MEPILCFPDPPDHDVQKALAAAGFSFLGATGEEAARQLEPGDGWPAAVVSAVDSFERAIAFAGALRAGEGSPPVVVVISTDQLARLADHRDAYDDFSLDSVVKEELETRLAALLARRGRRRDDVIVYGPLALNLETYQAVVSGRPLDLTYMEYELLRFLASNPGKVFTREALLSRVWGYEYFGGARTVDVHVRRLRAKLGEENAHLIETVRSVGYRFGTARWTP